MHRQHPLICVWDDHERANNTWSGGAENHNPEKGEGDWFARGTGPCGRYSSGCRFARTGRLGPLIYRTLRFGDLADLVMLDNMRPTGL